MQGAAVCLDGLLVFSQSERGAAQGYPRLLEGGVEHEGRAEFRSGFPRFSPIQERSPALEGKNVKRSLGLLEVLEDSIRFRKASLGTEITGTKHLVEDQDFVLRVCTPEGESLGAAGAS